MRPETARTPEWASPRCRRFIQRRARLLMPRSEGANEAASQGLEWAAGSDSPRAGRYGRAVCGLEVSSNQPGPTGTALSRYPTRTPAAVSGDVPTRVRRPGVGAGRSLARPSGEDGAAHLVMGDCAAMAQQLSSMSPHHHSPAVPLVQWPATRGSAVRAGMEILDRVQGSGFNPRSSANCLFMLVTWSRWGGGCWHAVRCRVRGSGWARWLTSSATPASAQITRNG
jgi:hypothetical protein